MQVTGELIAKLKEGVKTINEQHPKIFDLTTDLFAHCTGDDAEENRYFGSLYQSMTELVVTHFKTEENLMLETNFNFYAYSDHKREHYEFVSAVSGYIEKFLKTGNINLLMFASYAKWWVIGHIKRHDRQYINYFNNLMAFSGIEKMNV